MLFLSWSAINRRYSGVFSLHEDFIIVTYHYPGWRMDWKQTTLELLFSSMDMNISCKVLPYKGDVIGGTQINVELRAEWGFSRCCFLPFGFNVGVLI